MRVDRAHTRGKSENDGLETGIMGCYGRGINVVTCAGVRRGDGTGGAPALQPLDGILLPIGLGRGGTRPLVRLSVCPDPGLAAGLPPRSCFIFTAP